MSGVSPNLRQYRKKSVQWFLCVCKDEPTWAVQIAILVNKK